MPRPVCASSTVQPPQGPEWRYCPGIDEGSPLRALGEDGVRALQDQLARESYGCWVGRMYAQEPRYREGHPEGVCGGLYDEAWDGRSRKAVAQAERQAELRAAEDEEVKCCSFQPQTGLPASPNPERVFERLTRIPSQKFRLGWERGREDKECTFAPALGPAARRLGRPSSPGHHSRARAKTRAQPSPTPQPLTTVPIPAPFPPSTPSPADSDRFSEADGGSTMTGEIATQREEVRQEEGGSEEVREGDGDG
eukprot:Hpha_TRINITY_DN5645_c0_g1::TRINITY_DN5645_c0_g1_i1::g.50676::m.50676